MPKIAAVAILIAVLLAAVPEEPIYADTCQAGAAQQADMHGIYVNPESPMRVEVYPCGGVYVQWENAYGTHGAAYGTVRRLEGGGVAATGINTTTGVFLDGSQTLGIKPAEPGYVQVITLGVYDASYRVYRLKKIA